MEKYLLNYNSVNIKKREDETEYISGSDLMTDDEIKKLL
jgi:hypothetical protein